MKVLFIGSGCACRLPFAEHLFKKKLLEAEVTGVEVETADMAEWGVTPKDEGATSGNASSTTETLLTQADFIVVMEERQRDFLTKFMDYSNWSKIHLFLDYCRKKKGLLTSPWCGNLSYRTPNEEVNDGCQRLLERLKVFLKEHFMEMNGTVSVPT